MCDQTSVPFSAITNSAITECYAPACVITLSNAAGLQLQVLDYGATWLSCSLPLPEGGRREVVLACDSLQALRQQNAYVGATVGRFANRIHRAQFCIDGEMVKLVANEGRNHLHGGAEGFDRRYWRIEAQSARSVSLSLLSPDGDQGYPGQVEARVTYALGEDLSVEVIFEASTSKACPINLTHHAYFNLDGDAGAASRKVIEHELQVASAYWLPLDEEHIPVDDFVSVAGTDADLRQPRRLKEADEIGTASLVNDGSGDDGGDDHDDDRYAFNHCYALDRRCVDGELPAAILGSGDGRVQMQLFTDAPALQVYNGAYFAGTPARDGTIYPAYAGIALEPQFAPDSPNRIGKSTHWPDCVLRPGQLFRRRSLLRFMVA